MRVERFPITWDPRERFATLRVVTRFTCGVVYSAEQAGRCFLIVDESEFNDRITPGTEQIIYSLIGVHEFDSAAERTDYLRKRGWGEQDQ